MVVLGIAGGRASAAAAATDAAYLFSFFRDNGQDGLFLAWSTNGLQWSELKPAGKSFLVPELGPHKLMRDPCLRLGPDGVFHMVWTTGWGDRIIGHASSRDLRQWSAQQAIPVMDHEPTALNAWAPELFYDTATAQWFIFWASTIPGRFPETEGAGDEKYNHRIYATTTKDFQAFTPTRLFYDGGFNVIDATLFTRDGRYHLLVKDETLKPVKKHLRLTSASRADGPFEPASPPLTGDWVEGPSALEVGDWLHVYFDHYARPQYYGVVRTRDLRQWENVTDQAVFPPGARHGTMLRVPATVLAALR